MACCRPWSSWFGEPGPRALVEDQALWAAIEPELPRLPLSYFDDDADAPSGWDRRPAGYLLLSAPYAAEAEEARARGWPVLELADAHHLTIATEPDRAATALLELERLALSASEDAT